MQQAAAAVRQQQQQNRIPEQQGVGQTLPPVPVGIDTSNAAPLPPGAMPPGTRLQVGKYQVIVHNFIAEGGFAHVYLARIEGKTGYVVLKRVAVPDGERLKMVEKEIAFMRRLGDHKNIVRYYESRIDALPVGGFEALILMEYCPGGGVIDLMNRRLQQRLTEPEILKIFNDVAEALAYMHYCNPPVLHRDLKVENILILNQDHYKLCDFGSAALSRGNYTPTTLQDVRKIEDDIQRHTTLQYRAPEMVDVYLKRPINEKADIWAMGVLLYKLCYYTTPFEEEGQLAILNARYTIPSMPLFSDGLRHLIVSMLQEDLNRRPNIYQVLNAVCQLRGVECPIRDIYIEPIITPNYGPQTQSAQAQAQPQPSQYNPPSTGNNASDNIIFEKISSPTQDLPHITPMRRGRPTKPEGTAYNNDTKDTRVFDPFDPNQVNRNATTTSGSSSPAPLSPSLNTFTSSFQNSFTPTTPAKDSSKSAYGANTATAAETKDRKLSSTLDTTTSSTPVRVQSVPIIEEPKPQMATRILRTQPSTPSSRTSIDKPPLPPTTTTTTTELYSQQQSEEGITVKKALEDNARETPRDKNDTDLKKKNDDQEHSDNQQEAKSHSGNSARLSRSVSANIEARFMAIKNASRNNHQTIKTSRTATNGEHSPDQSAISNEGNATPPSIPEPSKKNKPAPPPKPARFRSAVQAKKTAQSEYPNKDSNTTEPSVDDFEYKFPSLEDLDKAISSP